MRRSLLCTLPFFAGCYTYATVSPEAARPGMSVRARVSGATAELVAPLIGSSDARLLDGRVIANGPDTMIVEVPTVMQASIGSTVETLHQRVALPRAAVYELETRRLDRMRTGALLGSAAVIIGVSVIKAIKSDPGKERVPVPPGGNDVRIPLLGLRW
jgi:hypothetical protein